MKIGIIDADLIGRSKHRFPNLACEKISGYWKDQGAEVQLLLDYNWDSDFDHVYISKVFTDTPVPYFVEELVDGQAISQRVHIGGTGFYFDKAPNLPDEIEHHMPDYHLYDQWIADEVVRAKATAEANGKVFNQSRYMVQFKEYTDYSIGFITRGCFRKCKFCVNQKFDHVFPHSPLEEFYDPQRKKICLLDDNFLGCPQWKKLLQQLIDTGKSFKFKQGLDERILTDEKCRMQQMKNEIQTVTWKYFDEMIWKKNTFGRISINDSYDITVYNRDNIEMTGSLSATEQMALAYAFTLAIHSASGKNCPLVIDSPLGRVSDENRENMALALKDVSREKQIIMLFTPDEYSEQVKRIYDSVADVRELTLSADEKFVEGIEH